MSAFRVLVATGMAVILAAFTFCASYAYLSTIFMILGLSLAMAPYQFGTGDLGTKIFPGALPGLLLVALILGLLAGATTFIFVIQLPKPKA